MGTTTKLQETPDPKTGLTPTEQRLQADKETEKAIHESIFPAGETLPAKLTPADQERLAKMASKTNVLRSILVNVKGIASDVRAILIALVSLSWAVVGLVASVSLFIFFLVLVLALMSSRFAYVFFAGDKNGSTKIGTMERLKETLHKTIVGR